eukprot:Lankesteria_metandrocarpae@DN4361_c0_g1_i1.p2
MGRNTRMQQWINYRIRVTLQDGRMLVGTFMAFDRHMNLVVADTEEYRRVKQKGNQEGKEIKRTLGFVLVRGGNIVAITAEAAPAAQPRRPGEGIQPGPGKAAPAGRGMPAGSLSLAPGLAGPIRGVGGPGPSAMGVQRPGMPFMAAPPLLQMPPGRPGMMPVMGGMPPGFPGGVMMGVPPGGVPPGMGRGGPPQ